MSLFKTIFFHIMPDAISATLFPFVAQDSSALFVRIMICAKFVSKSTATTILCSKYVSVSKRRSALMSIFPSTDNVPVLRSNLPLRWSTCNNYRQRRDVIEFWLFPVKYLNCWARKFRNAWTLWGEMSNIPKRCWFRPWLRTKNRLSW